jgi:hypothetical protein
MEILKLWTHNDDAVRQTTVTYLQLADNSIVCDRRSSFCHRALPTHALLTGK